MTAFAVCLQFALASRHFERCAFQVFHRPDFIDQTVPFASFDSSFEGCQHTFGPHARFRPHPAEGFFKAPGGCDFSALFSLWHSQQVIELRCHFPHVSTFLPPFSTVVTRFLATMGTLTPVLLRRAPGQLSLLTELALPDI